MAEVVSVEAYQEMVQAVRARSDERQRAEDTISGMSFDDYARRDELTRMLGIQGDCGCAEEWPVVMARLRECLTTYRLAQKRRRQ